MLLPSTSPSRDEDGDRKGMSDVAHLSDFTEGIRQSRRLSQQLSLLAASEAPPLLKPLLHRVLHQPPAVKKLLHVEDM